MLPLWNQVRKAFKRWAGSPAGRSLEPLPKEKANVRNLMKQALGVVQAAAGFQGKTITDREGLIAYMNEAVVDYGIRPKQKIKKGNSHVISAGDNGKNGEVVSHQNGSGRKNDKI